MGIKKHGLEQNIRTNPTYSRSDIWYKDFVILKLEFHQYPARTVPTEVYINTSATLVVFSQQLKQKGYFPTAKTPSPRTGENAGGAKNIFYGAFRSPPRFSPYPYALLRPFDPVIFGKWQMLSQE